MDTATQSIPSWYWAVCAFVLGCVVGSFLNVCIYRLPRNESLWWPPSHCPHCHHPIPWYLNIPILSWLILRGRCRWCGAKISVRYLLVEFLTGLVFLGLWLRFHTVSVWVVGAYALFAAILIAASFIDLEHYIIPDGLTLGGMVLGIFLSIFIPQLHGATSPAISGTRSLVGAGLGMGLLYLVALLGRRLFGRQTIELDEPIWFTLDREKIVTDEEEIPWEELLYRPKDTVKLEGIRVELPDRCVWQVPVIRTQTELQVGEEVFPAKESPIVRVEAQKVILPREAMGLGDVKFLGAIGAFLGWQGVIFTVAVSAVLGTVVTLLFMALGKHDRSHLIPYGPYLAVAALLWLFRGPELLRWWLQLGT